MPGSCATCGFPLDPGAPCPQCAAGASGPGLAVAGAAPAIGSVTLPPTPKWAIDEDLSDTAPGMPAPPREPVGAIARRPGTAPFDRVRTNPRIVLPAAAERADWELLGRRALAFTLDLAAIGALGVAFAAAGALAYGVADLAAAGGGSAAAGFARLLGDDPVAATAFALVVGALGGGYFVWFVGAEGRTPAMALLGLRIARADGAGSLSFADAASRFGALLLAALPLGLGLVWTAFSEVQRGLHDHLSGTKVVRA